MKERATSLYIAPTVASVMLSMFANILYMYEDNMFN